MPHFPAQDALVACASTAPELVAARPQQGTRTDWRVMLGLTRSDCVLVLGEDSGQVGRQLAPWVRKVHCAGDPLTVPMVVGQLDWIVVNGPMSGDRDFRAAVALLLPRLKPGGRLVVAFENRWGLGGTRRARRGRAGVSCRGLRDALSLMASTGCGALACYAVLPNRDAARTMIPVEPRCTPAAEKFALDQAWKRATPGRALGRLALHVLVDTHLLRHLYPHLIVVGCKKC